MVGIRGFQAKIGIILTKSEWLDSLNKPLCLFVRVQQSLLAYDTTTEVKQYRKGYRRDLDKSQTRSGDFNFVTSLFQLALFSLSIWV